MPAISPYRIYSIAEARRGGYAQAPEFYARDAKSLMRTISSIEDKRLELDVLTPHERDMCLPILEKYASIMRNSFIIVAQGFGYCLWMRDITRDN
jgi:hypothetical protein